MRPNVVMKKNNFVFARIPVVFLAMHDSNDQLTDRP